MTKRRCAADGCQALIDSRRYWMCPPCWRLLPAEVRTVVRASFRSMQAEHSRAAAEAALENTIEARRVLLAIKAGVPA